MTQQKDLLDQCMRIVISHIFHNTPYTLRIKDMYDFIMDYAPQTQKDLLLALMKNRGLISEL